MAKYDKEFLQGILDADEFDILIPEFIARGAGKVAQAGAVIHDCQQETVKTAMHWKIEMMDKQIGPGDPWYEAISDSFQATSQAQSTMWDALGQIAHSMSKAVARQI